ncbi:hypothetical protein KJ966_10850 [bacterium]|nr:hypothetical protein [bacterium]
MTKILIFLALGYLFFKIAKNGIHVAIENFFNKPKIKDSTDLTQCNQCNGFVSKEIMHRHDNKDFCSQQCIDDYIKSSDRTS